MDDTITDSRSAQKAQSFRERGDTAKKLIFSLAESSPLVGKSETDMNRINVECVGYQDALREAVLAGMFMRIPPEAAFTAALAGLLIAIANQPQTDQTREAIGYILSVKGAIESAPEGPAILLEGEVEPRAVIDTREPVPPELRERFGLDETVKPGSFLKREGNVIHAEGHFPGPKTTVH